MTVLLFTFLPVYLYRICIKLKLGAICEFVRVRIAMMPEVIYSRFHCVVIFRGPFKHTEVNELFREGSKLKCAVRDSEAEEFPLSSCQLPVFFAHTACSPPIST